jgi:membrane-associated phospholipid phosphatase
VSLTRRRRMSVLVATAAGLSVVAAGFVLRFYDRLDERAVTAVHGWALRQHAAVYVSRVISTVGEPIVWEVLGGVAAVWLWSRGRGRAARQLVVGLVGAQLLSSGAKLVVARPRPVLPHPLAHATGYSFPSGHALLTTTAVLLALGLANLGRGFKLYAGASLALLTVLAVGTSRVVLGVHYPSDVIGGLAMGAVWVLAVIAVGGPARRATETSRTLPHRSGTGASRLT